MYIKPKKSLGQNFIFDKNIQKKIVLASGLDRNDIVLEIGAGFGDLTKEIALSVKKVYALEIDQRLFEGLEKNLNCKSNCEIIKKDILEFDLDKFLAKYKIKQKIKVIGNIPYYISSPIIEHLIKYHQKITAVYLTVQKEFGRRVCAGFGSKEYGSFSCFVQYYAHCKIIFEIKKGSFRPAPKVDSCFLSLKFRDHPVVKVNDEERLFGLIRTAFNQRRKTLKNSLLTFISKDRLEEILCSLNIDINTRPEDLSLEQFAQRSNSLDSALKIQKIA